MDFEQRRQQAELLRQALTAENERRRIAKGLPLGQEHDGLVWIQDENVPAGWMELRDADGVVRRLKI